MDKKTILIVEDEPEIRECIRILLSGEGYDIREAEDGFRALDIFSEDVDLVILDVMMPGISGLRVCEELRKTSAVPILFLTAKGQESDKLIGLSAGGDDYLVKPFSYTELTARVRALLRRYYVYRGKEQPSAGPEDKLLHAGRLTLSRDANQAWLDGGELDLTEIEYGILRLLAEHPRKIFSAENIYESVWNQPYYYTSGATVMVHIRNLRVKLEQDPQNPKLILTVWGKGYRLGTE